MELKKELTLIHLVGIASGAMISSGLFVLPGLMFAKAGPGIILAYALASLLVIPALLSKAELSTAMPKAAYPSTSAPTISPPPPWWSPMRWR